MAGKWIADLLRTVVIIKLFGTNIPNTIISVFSALEAPVDIHAVTLVNIVNDTQYCKSVSHKNHVDLLVLNKCTLSSIASNSKIL